MITKAFLIVILVFAGHSPFPIVREVGTVEDCQSVAAEVSEMYRKRSGADKAGAICVPVPFEERGT